jgi:hypothetical protein
MPQIVGTPGAQPQLPLVHWLDAGSPQLMLQLPQ